MEGLKVIFRNLEAKSSREWEEGDFPTILLEEREEKSRRSITLEHTA